MNLKITEQQHHHLCEFDFKEYLFGSKLHGIDNPNSDTDYVRVIGDEFYENFSTPARYFPNIHSLQYDDKEENMQFIWMTESQFYRGLFSGDGNNLADIVLLSGKFKNPLELCRTYKIIKGYLGVAKRDLKLHGMEDKKKFHALRSMYMAEKLMAGEVPTVEGIQLLHNNYSGCHLPSKEALEAIEVRLRKAATKMFELKELSLYPIFAEQNAIVNIIALSNNITQFKYD